LNLLLAACVVGLLDTPTPMLQWDEPFHVEGLAGFDLYAQEANGPFVRTAQIDCQWKDTDVDGLVDTRSCRGLDIAIPVQRYCISCGEGIEYRFTVKARQLNGFVSETTPAPIRICMPPICVRPAACN